MLEISEKGTIEQEQNSTEQSPQKLLKKQIPLKHKTLLRKTVPP